MQKDKNKKPKTLSITLIQEVATDRKGKEIKDEKGNKSYKRDDFIGLLQLLNRFNSKFHEMKDYKLFLKLKDHLLENWKKDDLNLELTLDEATFLKDYLSELPNKDAKDQGLAEFELRTLCGILEQLE